MLGKLRATHFAHCALSRGIVHGFKVPDTCPKPTHATTRTGPKGKTQGWTRARGYLGEEIAKVRFKRNPMVIRRICQKYSKVTITGLNKSSWLPGWWNRAIAKARFKKNPTWPSQVTWVKKQGRCKSSFRKNSTKVNTSQTYHAPAKKHDSVARCICPSAPQDYLKEIGLWLRK